MGFEIIQEVPDYRHWVKAVIDDMTEWGSIGDQYESHLHHKNDDAMAINEMFAPVKTRSIMIWASIDRSQATNSSQFARAIK